MQKYFYRLAVLFFLSALALNAGACSGNGPGKSSEAIPLVAEGVDDTGDGETGTGEDEEIDTHEIFHGRPGDVVSVNILSPDSVTGQSIASDYDGDGIPNEDEIITNPFVADYPRIVTRIIAPITMEIRISESSESSNHAETLENSDLKETITNSMENRQYTSINEKTTPVPTKESSSSSESSNDAYGYSTSSRVSGGVNIFGCGGSFSGESSNAENWETAESFSQSHMSEMTVFEDVDYRDNLDRNGVEFTNETIQNMSRNCRKSEILKETDKIGPNDGYVRAGLFLKNMSVNIPVRISNVKCTLSFRTPAGEFLPVKTFYLRNEDYSSFEEDVYGDQELGSFTIEVKGLNTKEVKKALENGYVPQIHVVSYDMRRVDDSGSAEGIPLHGIDNLKIIEENTKSRTATITVSGRNMREHYRVAAFDVDGEGNISPGISLKKALFNIYRSRAGIEEQWDEAALSVSDDALRWKTGLNDHGFEPGSAGNSWDMFETYIKTYTDEKGVKKYIETIKRIGSLSKYNPFNPEDNAEYDPNKLLSDSELRKMKYWIILHNGRYFKGDINDPIWAGERFEIIFFDVADYNDHFKNYYYTPLQSKSSFLIDTRWNALSNSDEFSRATYIGKIVEGDVVHLELDLLETRFLLDRTGIIESGNVEDTFIWEGFPYTFQCAEVKKSGKPKDFTHAATGGINSIRVVIKESCFAEKYQVTIKDPDDTGEGRIIPITAEEVRRENGVVYLDRHSLDNSGLPLGMISSGRYMVNVSAVGNVYGCEALTSSLDNGETAVTVTDAAEGINSGDFYYSAEGYLNRLDVKIQEAPNTEYYRITIDGPLNYGDESRKTITKYGNPGLNSFELENPEGRIVDPGVYNVAVRSVNVNNAGTGRMSSQGWKSVCVNYEKYSAQKVYSPAVSTELADLGALDLEVNFNDGADGWYHLKLKSGEEKGKYIDCRYSSYIDYDRQTFHVFFKPPAGLDGSASSSTFNVFKGGKEEVDLYVRSVALPEYRDTFWPKPGRDNLAIQTATDYTDFVSFWTRLIHSDASNLEKTLSKGADGEVILASSEPDDYFFSPLVHRVFQAKVTLNNKIHSVDENMIDEPAFKACAREKSIRLYDFESQLADSYKIFWRPVSSSNEGSYESLVKNENLEEYPWNSSDMVQPGSSPFQTFPDGTRGYVIDNLPHNHSYIVAVMGINKYGKLSEPVYFKNTSGMIAELVPWSFDPPAKPEGIAVNKGTIVDGQPSIVVTNIHVPGETRYRVDYKRECDASWTSMPVERPEFTVGSKQIKNLQYFEHYQVRVCAIGGPADDPVEGTMSDVYAIETQAENTVSARAEWGDRETEGKLSGANGIFYFARLMVHVSNIPENVVSYSVSASVESHEAEYYYGGFEYLNTISDPETEIFQTDFVSASAGNVYIGTRKCTAKAKDSQSQYYSGVYSKAFYYNTTVRIRLTMRNRYGDIVDTDYFITTPAEMGNPPDY